MSNKESKAVRGILGVRKSAQSQVLLFGRYSEPLPSDDSDDSDYEPTDISNEENVSTTKSVGSKNIKKTTTIKRTDLESKTKKKTKHSSLLSTVRKQEESSIVETKRRKTSSSNVLEFNKFSNAWSDVVPSEVLLEIFLYCVETQGAVPLLSRLSRVCRRWNLLAKEPKLYRKMNLSCLGKYSIANDSLIKQFVGRGLTGVEDLSLDGWIKLSDKGVEVISKNCKKLMSISLSNCEGLSPKVLNIMADNCTKLMSIDMSGIKIDHNSLKKLLCQNGSSMQELLLRNCKGFPGSAILPMIQDFCPNLLHLDLSGTPVRQIKIEQLQERCPKLKNLQLANLVLQPSYSRSSKLGPSNGFSELEHLSLACGFQGSLSVNDTLISRLLKTSTFLRVLDIRGCNHVTKQAIQGLCATSIESLYIGNTDAKQPVVETVLNKWHSSLVHLDLGYNPAIRDDTMALFERFSLPNLIRLDLTSTGVSITGVGYVVKGCLKLQDLNLSSCRGIPRGLKQRYTDERYVRLTEKLSTGSLELDNRD